MAIEKLVNLIKSEVPHARCKMKSLGQSEMMVLEVLADQIVDVMKVVRFGEHAEVDRLQSLTVEVEKGMKYFLPIF